MMDLPGVIFVIDSTKEEIAILEAQKLNIPIVAVVDTNGDPENIDYPIPGNDDAVRAIELFASKVSEAITEGKKERIERELQGAKEEEVLLEGNEISPLEEGGPAEEGVVGSEKPDVTE
jgi:small subunit ribosomal protein S2